LTSKLDFNFSQRFSGIVWNTLAIPGTDLLVIEARDEKKREARFSLLDFKKNDFLWKDKLFEEKWWIGLTTATPNVLLFHVFQSMDNPDVKALMAWHIHEQRVLWKLEHFSFSRLEGEYIHGLFAKEELQPKIIDIATGESVENVPVASDFMENIMLQKPFQYIDGNVHFETVKTFLTSRLNIVPVIGVEYLEYRHLIFISYQVQLENMANYLVVFSEAGDLVFQEKLGDHLKGLGLDTFFILSGFLFFVSNKSELFSYRIV
jgi:hypothetical protein